MKFAYADPPYLGLAGIYAKLHPEAMIWNEPETHRKLIEHLSNEYPDGWVYSLHTPSLRTILPMCPEDTRVSAWVKPFASFKPGVNPAYAWEPILIRGGRPRTRQQMTVRDWVSCPITLQRGFIGAKPEGVCFWMFEFMGMEPSDEFHDLFPGSGAVTQAWEKWKRQPRLREMHSPMDLGIIPLLLDEGD